MLIVSGDRDEEGYKKSIKDFPGWFAVKYGENIDAIKAKIPLKHYPLPGIIDAKSGEVLNQNAWGKLDENSF